MANAKHTAISKVEARSRTGGRFRRAGGTWTPDWQEVPAEIIADKAKMKLLEDDKSIEFRVDGKRVPKFAGDPGDPEPVEPAEFARLRSGFRELEEAHSRLSSERDKLRDDHAAEVALLKNRIMQLELARSAAVSGGAGQTTTMQAGVDASTAVQGSTEGQGSTTTTPSAPPAETAKSGPKK